MLALLIGFFLGIVTLGHLSPLPTVFLLVIGGVLGGLCLSHWLIYIKSQQNRQFVWRLCHSIAIFLCSFVLGAGYAGQALQHQLTQITTPFTTSPHFNNLSSPQHPSYSLNQTHMVQITDISLAVNDKVKLLVSPVSLNQSVDGQSINDKNNASQKIDFQKIDTKHDIKWLLSPMYGKSDNKLLNRLNTSQVGDVLQVDMRLAPARGIATAGVFSEEKWLLTLGVSKKAHVSHIKRHIPYQKIKHQHTLLQRFRFALANQRLSIRQHIAQLQPSHLKPSDATDDKAVLLALLTGDRALLSASIKNQYQHMGISHLLAISGPHVLFASSMFIWLLLLFLNRFARLYRHVPRRMIVLPMTLLIAIAYALLAGWDLPAQRTVWMLAISIIAVLSNKQLSFWVILLLTGCVIFILDPLAVLTASFWLSFVAVGLLVLFAQSGLVAQDYQADIDLTQNKPMLPPLMSFIKLQGVFFLAILPISVVFFGKVSWLTPLVNLVAIPFLGFVVVPLNIIALVLHGISPSLADMLWYVLIYLLHGFHASLAWLQHTFPNALLGLYFDKTSLWSAVLILLIWLLPFEKKYRWLTPPLLGLFFAPRLLPAPATIHVFDGTDFTAVLIKAKTHHLLKSEKNLLYISDVDLKKDVSFTVNQVLIPALIEQNAQHIDQLIISFSDTKSLKKFAQTRNQIQPLNQSIHQLLLNNHNLTVKKVMSNVATQIKVQNADVKKQACLANTQWQWGSVRFKLLAPWQNVPITGDDASCVLKVSMVQSDKPVKKANTYNSLLLMGNASLLTKNMLWTLCDDVDANLLLVAQQGQKITDKHHFNNQSLSNQLTNQPFSNQAFIKKVAPKRALLANHYRHRNRPHIITRTQIENMQIPLDITTEKGSLTYYLGDEQKNTAFARDTQPWLLINKW